MRSLVEAKEREVGLRCDDLSCIRGPEDDDEVPTPTPAPLPPPPPASGVPPRAAAAHERRRMRAEGVRVRESACAHAFHPEGLVLSARCCGPGRSRAGVSTRAWAMQMPEVVTSTPRLRLRARGANGPPAEEETHGKGKEREREVREVGVQCDGADC